MTYPSLRKVKILKTLTRADFQFDKRILSSEPCASSRTTHKTPLLKATKVSLCTTKRDIVQAGFTCTNPRYCQIVRHVNKEKWVDFCKMQVENNDEFNDMMFTEECTVQLHKKVYSYRKLDQVRPPLPKPKHPLKDLMWDGISKWGATPIRRDYDWTVLYRPHPEGNLPVVRQMEVLGLTTIPNGPLSKTGLTFQKPLWRPTALTGGMCGYRVCVFKYFRITKRFEGNV